jgi:hypothetical protein
MTRKEQKFIDQARERFRKSEEQERRIRDEAMEDLRFRSGDQWDPEMERRRKAEGRPALTFDKTHVFIQSVANEARQNKPAPKVNPIGGGATTDIANVINGIFRHIDYRSKADVAYDTALDYSVGSSFGFIRAITEYADPKSFDQEIRILAVIDPFSVYGVLVPTALGEPVRYAFVIKTITKEEYADTYGDTDRPTDWESSEWRQAGDWCDGDQVRIAEYWWVETKKKTLRHIQGKDGTTLPIFKEDAHYKDSYNFVMDDDGEPMERTVDCPCVYSCLIDGTRVLPGSKTEWAGDSIPIVAVMGQTLVVDGEVRIFSLIRFIRDVQRLINIYESAIAEKIGLANRVPYLGYKGQFNDPKWQDCNVRNYAYLEADVVTINGTAAPLPQRQQLEEQITALSNALAREIDNLKAGMGIFDASLGNNSNEISGTGINARQQQSNVTNFHFSDNLQRAQWDLSKKLLPVIPKIYDRPGRQVRIVGEDQEQSVVTVNQPYIDPKTGQKKHYALDAGEYDVTIAVGPSYTTARAEAADTLQQFFKAAPNTVPLLGDLWVGNLDYPWSREAARRLKLAAPQNIVNAPEDGPNAIPPQVQAQMAQLQQELQQAHQFAAALHEQIQTKQPEINARVAIAQMQEETKRTIAIATLNAQRGEALLESEDEAAQQLAAHQMAVRQQAMDHAHDVAMTAAKLRAARLQQGQQQQFDAASQLSQQAHQSNQQQAAQDAQLAQQQPQDQQQDPQAA